MILHKLQKFFALSAVEKAVLIQSWFLLGYIRVGIIAMPFKRLVGPLEHRLGPLAPPSLTAEQLRQATRIGYLVAAAAGTTPWQSLCLAQVLVTQRLLAKRGIPGQFYLGVKRVGKRLTDLAELSGHAWLQCGDLIVIGAVGHEQFTVVSTFPWGSNAELASSVPQVRVQV